MTSPSADALLWAALAGAVLNVVLLLVLLLRRPRRPADVASRGEVQQAVGQASERLERELRHEIGEAPSQLSKQDAGMAARIPHAAQVVAFRNLLIHGYAAVHVRRVWEVVENDLPQLEASVARLQAEIYGRQRSGGETPREGDEA
ncbi:MAG: DUF86 domain-containing protein [Ottowia sp.]|uniref:HepT-like ribonuclease domain-containing protein n=1 Tax=Ottowia sp. TaxID=1898956 RepID=UPI0039E285C0